MVRVCPKRDAVCPHGMDCPYVIDEANCKPETTPMTDKAPERIHVRWGKSGDTRVTYMEERFWPPDNEAEYVRADALEAAQARIAELEAESLKAFEDGMAQGFKAARAEALEEAAKAADDFSWVLPFYGKPDVDEATDDCAEAVCEQLAAAIRALKGETHGD